MKDNYLEVWIFKTLLDTRNKIGSVQSSLNTSEEPTKK